MDFLNFFAAHQPSGLYIVDMIYFLGVAFILSLLVIFVYTKTYSGVMYSRAFIVSLLVMNLVTALVVMALARHLIIAIGMIGALSIVRFRTVIKEPLDLVYIYWAITVGIITGVGLVPLAVVGSIFIAISIFLFYSNKTNMPYVLIISATSDTNFSLVHQLVNKVTKKNIVKSKTNTPESIEVIYEVRLKSQETNFIDRLQQIPGVVNISLVAYNGDYYM